MKLINWRLCINQLKASKQINSILSWAFVENLFYFHPGVKQRRRKWDELYHILWRISTFVYIIASKSYHCNFTARLQFGNDHDNDFWFHFQPVIQSVQQIPISRTLLLHSAVIYHLSNKINLFPCPLRWLGVYSQTCHISHETTR